MSQSTNPNLGSRISQTLGNTSARLIAVHVKSANKSIFRALLRLGSANLLTRVAGMVMNIIIAAQFGQAGRDPYSAIYLMVTSIAALFGGGLEASVIPVYSRVRVKGKDKVSTFFSTLLNVLVLFLILFTAIMFLFRAPFILSFAPNLGKQVYPGTHLTALDITIGLAPYLFPVVILMTLNYFLECLLNAEGQFGWPAYAGMLVPISTTITLVFSMLFTKNPDLRVVCTGQLIGFGLQFIVVLFRIRQAKIIYRPVLDLKSPEIRAVARAAGPPLFGSFIALSGPWFDQAFTNVFGEAGSISALNDASKLTSVFSGVIFSSVARSALPYLSSQAAIKDWKAFKGTIRLYIWVLGIIMSALAAGVILFAPFIVRILFQRGNYTAANAHTTSTLLVALTLGLRPMAIAFFTSRAFSALGKTRILVWSTVLNMVVNAVLDAVLGYFLRPYGLGPFGVALATSIFYFVSMFFLLIVLRAIVGPLYLFTPPPELISIVSKFIGRKSTQQEATWTWWEENFGALEFTHALKRKMIRGAFMLSVFAAGVVGCIVNALFTMRVAFGSIVLLILIRYPYSLLISWIMLGSFVGSDVPFLSPFQGGNLLSGLAIGSIFTFLIIPAKPAIKRFSSLGLD